jgi:tetratricopeptide (TPR) repeat protein
LEHLLKGQEFGGGSEAINRVAQGHLAQLLIKAEHFEQALSILAGLAQSGDSNPRLITITGHGALRRPLLVEEAPPNDRELVYLAGKAFWEASARRSSGAVTNFEYLIRKYPSAAGVHYLYGTFLLLQGDVDKAVGQFEEELKVSSSAVPALAALAYEYVRREDPDKGLPYAKRAVELRPDVVAPHVLYGKLLLLKGDLEGGVHELEIAKRVDPNDPQPRIALASGYAKLGRTEDAARERREFVRLKEAGKPQGEK